MNDKNSIKKKYGKKDENSSVIAQGVSRETFRLLLTIA